MLPFIVLVLHTVSLWFLIFYLHTKRKKISLVPLYSLIATLMVLTHVLSTAGLHLVVFGQFFLISSTAYFTPLLLAVLILYLLDGPKAAQEALKITVGVSLLLVATVFLVNIEDSAIEWIPSVSSTYKNYFWSVLALILDIVFLGICWELLSKIKKLPLAISVSTVFFLVFVLDAFTFVTGVFVTEPHYWSIIKSDVIVRFVLSVIMGFFVSRYLKREEYSEDKRDKPNSLWEIVNFRASAEKTISSLKTELNERRILENKLKSLNGLYELVLQGADVGIWSWDIKTNEIEWSDRFFQLLGYTPNEFEVSYEKWMELTHAEDRDTVLAALEKHTKGGKAFKVTYRLKNKSGDYTWVLSSAKMRVDKEGNQELMAGSVTDVTQEREAKVKLQKKLKELTDLNKRMVDRELRMVELKKKLKDNTTD